MCRWVIYKGIPVPVADLLLKPERNLQWLSRRDIRCLPHLPFSSSATCLFEEEVDPAVELDEEDRELDSTIVKRNSSHGLEDKASFPSLSSHQQERNHRSSSTDSAGSASTLSLDEELVRDILSLTAGPEALSPEKDRQRRPASPGTDSGLSSASSNQLEDSQLSAAAGSTTARGQKATTKRRAYSIFTTLSHIQRNHLKNEDGYGIAWFSSKETEAEVTKAGTPSSRLAASTCLSSPLSPQTLRRTRNGDRIGNTLSPKVHRKSTCVTDDKDVAQALQGVVSGCICAHVRAASKGLSVQESNCHPFSAGNFVWMHNGCVAYFSKVREDLLPLLSAKAKRAIQGTTDSELAFALFLSHFDDFEAVYSKEKIADAMQRTIRTIVRKSGAYGPCASSLNFCVTNGKVVVCSRFRNCRARQQAPSLYWVESVHLVPASASTSGAFSLPILLPSSSFASTMAQIKEGRDIDGVKGGERERKTAVVVASEPIATSETHDHWQLVPNNHLLLIDEEERVIFQPLLSLSPSVDQALRKWRERAATRIRMRNLHLGKTMRQTGDAAPLLPPAKPMIHIPTWSKREEGEEPEVSGEDATGDGMVKSPVERRNEADKGLSRKPQQAGKYEKGAALLSARLQALLSPLGLLRSKRGR